MLGVRDTHDDYAYEFQIGWSLWELEKAGAGFHRIGLEQALSEKAHATGSEHIGRDETAARFQVGENGSFG